MRFQLFVSDKATFPKDHFRLTQNRKSRGGWLIVTQDEVDYGDVIERTLTREHHHARSDLYGLNSLGARLLSSTMTTIADGAENLLKSFR